MAFWDEKLEKLPRPELRQLQVERLQSALNRACRQVAFYKGLFDTHRLEPAQVKDLASLRRIPFTTKEHLRQSYPYGMFAVPLKDVVRIHSTSGTTGKPIGIGYTANDLRHWGELVARLLTAGGVTSHDRVQVAFQYSLFTGGFGLHQGAERIGASVIPASSSVTLQRQIEIMRDFKSTVLCCSPSFALRLAYAVEEAGLHAGQLHLRYGHFGAEPWSENLRGQLESLLDLEAFDNYGLTEILGPGVAFECSEHAGMHIQEDHFIVEVVDPETGADLPPGQAGELVFTTITKEAFPLIRYRTGDIAALDETPCKCGRTGVRMSRVSGRTDDLLFAQGVKFFPSQIEDVLLSVERLRPHFEIELSGQHGDDRLEVRVERPPQQAERADVEMAGRIAEALESALGLKARLTFVSPGLIPTSEGKRRVPVTDKR